MLFSLLLVPFQASAASAVPTRYNPSITLLTTSASEPEYIYDVNYPYFDQGGIWYVDEMEGDGSKGYIESILLTRRTDFEDEVEILALDGAYTRSAREGYQIPIIEIHYSHLTSQDTDSRLHVNISFQCLVGYDGTDSYKYLSYFTVLTPQQASSGVSWETLLAEAEAEFRANGHMTQSEQILCFYDIEYRLTPYYNSTQEWAIVDIQVGIEYPSMATAMIESLNAERQIQQARQQGYSEGYEEGVNEGYSNGYSEGYEEGASSGEVLEGGFIGWLLSSADALLSLRLLKYGAMEIQVIDILSIALLAPLLRWFLKVFAGG